LTQKELLDVHKRHVINLKLEEMITKEGVDRIVQSRQVASLLTTPEEDMRHQRDFYRIDQRTLHLEKLKEDLKLVLTNYALEVNKNKELGKEITRLLSERNIFRQKYIVFTEVASHLDNLCSELKEKFYSFRQAHSKCKLTSSFKSINKSNKLNTDVNQELDLYHEFIEFLTQLNNKGESTNLNNQSKLKIVYKTLHSFFMTRLDFIQKRSRFEETEYEDQPFIVSFFYHILKTIGAGGSYNSQKMFDFLYTLTKCQMNTRVLIICRALGLVENNTFTIDMQKRYLQYLQMLLDYKEGIDVPLNLDACRQWSSFTADTSRSKDTRRRSATT